MIIKSRLGGGGRHTHTEIEIRTFASVESFESVEA
jgi:hypothetical protein